MGHMKMLESLDLSGNHLSGEIPTSFCSLTFLSFLDLSFNNLSGKIPQTTQLQTFNASSYIGNQLCGQPLTPCPRNGGSNNLDPNHNIDKGGDELVSFGFYVSLALGFVVGFWGVCGTLILKRSWRQAYYQLFVNMYDWMYVQVFIFKARMVRRFQH